MRRTTGSWAGVGVGRVFLAEGCNPVKGCGALGFECIKGVEGWCPGTWVIPSCECCGFIAEQWRLTGGFLNCEKIKFLEAGWRRGLKEAILMTGRQCRWLRWSTSKRSPKWGSCCWDGLCLCGAWGGGGAVLSNDKMIMKNRAINIPAKVNQTIVVWQLLV